MFFKKIKFVLVLLLFYQTPLYSKSNSFEDFDSRNLSKYFSGIVAFGNKDNSVALDFFNSTKILIDTHDPYLKRYVFSLVLDGQIKKAIYQIKILENSKNSNFFEAKLLLALDNITRKKYQDAEKILNKLGNFENSDNYEFVIYKIVEDYNKLFLTGIKRM